MFENFFDWVLGTKPKSNEQMLRNMFDAIRENRGVDSDPIVESEPAKSSIYRPETFDDYIGQTKAKNILKSYIKAIKERGNVLPHILLHGNAGCGKTTLMRIIAKEFGCKIEETIATDLQFDDMLNYFTNAERGMVFFDEVHRLSREVVEPIHTIMEDFTYDKKTLEPFCIAGATTELDEILKDRRPFYDRFKIIIELEDYTVEDLTEIVKKYKYHSFFGETVDESAYGIIASNCRGTPRTAIRYLESTIYLGGDVKIMLDNNNIIKNGFTNRDLNILEYIALNKNGVGLQGLASYLNISERLYMYEVEGFLLRQGLISRTSRGRKLTDKGMDKIKELKNG